MNGSLPPMLHPPAANPPPALRATLGGAHYTSADTFAAEQEHIFEEMWFCAVRSADLASPGQFRNVQVGRESVLLLRGRDGLLRAFLNVCRHRGARLCTEAEGQVRRNLRCAYHSWTYALDGKLVAAPNIAALTDETGAPIDRYQLRPGAGRTHRMAWLRLGLPVRRPATVRRRDRRDHEAAR